MCVSKESENRQNVESCSVGVTVDHRACVVGCGVGAVTAVEIGAMRGVRAFCVILRCVLRGGSVLTCRASGMIV